MRHFLLFCFLIAAFPSFAQDSLAVKSDAKIPDFNALDSLYREDQFYLGFTYNILQHRPEGLKQNKFSSGFSFGVLRDMPFNKSRTWAVAVGLGYSINNFNQNLQITESGGINQYNLIASDIAYDKNKLIIHYIDVPIEIRWRTSTPQSHKFWRVYTGVKLSYMVFNRYKYANGDDKFSSSNNDDLNKIQYGLYLATGYNTWNLNVYYGLSPLFKSDAKLNGNSIDMHTLNVGLMFYIL
ncbi:MAG: PorT family protein [Flavobacterium sp.]|nr:MAG: PorT family protein [Flavobacterium sp.]